MWGRYQYVTEANKQLVNREYYEHLQFNPIEQMKIELMEILLHAKTEHWISQKEHDFLLNDHPRIPSFYMLPKIHKNLWGRTHQVDQ